MSWSCGNETATRLRGNVADGMSVTSNNDQEPKNLVADSPNETDSIPTEWVK